MTKTPDLRGEDLDEYILFRIRLHELLHLWRAWATYGRVPETEPDSEITPTIAMAAMVWLHSFFDRDDRDLDVRRLWAAVFPSMKERIEAWEAEHQDTFALLKDFRNTTGAHFSRKIEDHNRVREAFHNGGMHDAIEAFIAIALEVLKHESERPELVEAAKSYGLPPAQPQKGPDPRT